jgi:hypothetical protein
MNFNPQLMACLVQGLGNDHGTGGRAKVPLLKSLELNIVRSAFIHSEPQIAL